MIFTHPPKNFSPEIEVASCLVLVEKEALFLKRSAKVTEPKLWGFPTGKVESGEALNEAMRRELFEETAISTENKNLQYFKNYAVRWTRIDFNYHLFVLNLK